MNPVWFLRFGLAALLLLGFIRPGSAQTAGNPAPGPELRLDWNDSTRNRPIPVKIYLPAPRTGPSPVIIFSHGLGGSRDGYVYLGQYWAAHGFVAVHLQHLGSDEALWKDAKNPMLNVQKAVLNPENALNRPKDVSFAIDQLTLLNEDKNSALYHRLNLKNIGMAGHSFGAFTSLAIAGETMGGRFGSGNRLADPRVSCAIEISAPGLRPGVDPIKAYEAIKIPMMHITGTEDKISSFLPVGSGSVADRRVPFDSITAPHQYLIIYDKADHMVFADSGRRELRAQDPAIRQSVCEMTTAFWNAWLKNDSTMKQWLDNGSATKSLDKLATVEGK